MIIKYVKKYIVYYAYLTPLKISYSYLIYIAHMKEKVPSISLTFERYQDKNNNLHVRTCTYVNNTCFIIIIFIFLKLFYSYYISICIFIFFLKIILNKI
jgi:hypothetical protein